MVVSLALPATAHAGILSAFTEKVKAVFLGAPEESSETSATSQTMPVFKPIVMEEEEP
jgi:hypothetical protein